MKPATGLCRNLTTLIATAILALGCNAVDADPAPRALPGSVDSLEELGAAVVAALGARDTARLDSLRLSEYEHNERIWPELPAGRPDVGFPVDLAWQNIQNRNRAALRRLLPHFATTPYTFVRTACRGETRRFEGFHVLTDCVVILRTADGEERELQLFKDVLVMDGEHKIFRYYAD